MKNIFMYDNMSALYFEQNDIQESNNVNISSFAEACEIIPRISKRRKDTHMGHQPIIEKKNVTGKKQTKKEEK